MLRRDMIGIGGLASPGGLNRDSYRLGNAD